MNLAAKKCGLFIYKQHEFLHATPDFLVSCVCYGTGCGEVKYPSIIKDGNFENFAKQKNSCLEKVNGHLQLRKSHSDYYQVQQQLFSVPGIKYCEFVVCAIDGKKSMNLTVLLYIQMCGIETRYCPNWKHFGEHVFFQKF